MLDVSLSGQDKYADLGATIGLATMHLPIEVPFRAARQKCLSHIVSKDALFRSVWYEIF